MPRMYSHPAKYREILLANCLCVGFVPGGIGMFKVCGRHVYVLGMTLGSMRARQV